jgi:hypothetical protein
MIYSSLIDRINPRLSFRSLISLFNSGPHYKGFTPKAQRPSTARDRASPRGDTYEPLPSPAGGGGQKRTGAPQNSDVHTSTGLSVSGHTAKMGACYPVTRTKGDPYGCNHHCSATDSLPRARWKLMAETDVHIDVLIYLREALKITSVTSHGTSPEYVALL